MNSNATYLSSKEYMQCKESLRKRKVLFVKRKFLRKNNF